MVRATCVVVVMVVGVQQLSEDAWGAAGTAKTGVAGGGAMDLASLKEARKKARHRRRRIIMNNDGNDLNKAKPEEPKTPELFLSARTTPLLGSQVDSIFYCSGVFNLYSHRSEESELLTSSQERPRYNVDLIKLGTDSVATMVDFGHKHGIEIFWSMRMNDTHDSGRPELLCKWKRDHPEYLVGVKTKKYPYGCNRWSSVDYGVPAVREKVFRILQDVCTRYDVDGIEMDFFRHPVLFKCQMTGGPVTQDQRDEMTALVRRVRRMTEEVGARRGRPVLVAVRIPDSVRYCKALGIDLVRWLEEDLIDIVTGGGYFKLEPWEDLVALGKKYDVPVYACLVTRRIAPPDKYKDGGYMRKVFRGEAMMAWRAGVDGIYLFNQFNPRSELFRELGDPKLLATLDRIDQTAYVEKTLWSRPERWLIGGQGFVKGGGGGKGK
ncbi:MAG: family 10 glycosylhydrolase [Phycisphaerae bacterium]|nr:family 10 glycosylhydrolase [Phycisphaerae bacterium]